MQENNYNNVNEKADYIFATFARSFDRSHIESQRPHIVSSVALDRLSDKELLILLVKYIIKMFEYKKSHKEYGFILLKNVLELSIFLELFTSSSVYLKNATGREYECVRKSIHCYSLTFPGTSLVLNLMTINYFLLHFNKEQNSDLNNVFGSSEALNKSFDSISSNSLFIFRNIH